MKILVVEDDKFCALALAEVLRDRGFDVDLTESVEEALGKELGVYDVTVIDVMLPNDPSVSGISVEESRGGYLAGVALARRLREVRPQLGIVLFSGGISAAEAQTWAEEQNIPFIYKYDGPQALVRGLEKIKGVSCLPPPRAFIVHGRDEMCLAELKDYLQNTLKWQEPVVLREQPSCGKTVIEKFEDYAGRIDCVFVLMTPDDVGGRLETNEERRRARQNVVFELGFFYGQMGRRSGRVIVLKKGAVEVPTDIAGIVWIDIEHGIRAAGEVIRKEVARFM